MKTVLFNQTVHIDFLQGKGVEIFERGEKYPLEDDQADRWIRRGKAEEVRPSVKESAAEEMEKLKQIAEASATAKKK